MWSTLRPFGHDNPNPIGTTHESHHRPRRRQTHARRRPGGRLSSRTARDSSRRAGRRSSRRTRRSGTAAMTATASAASVPHCPTDRSRSPVTTEMTTAGPVPSTARRPAPRSTFHGGCGDLMTVQRIDPRRDLPAQVRQLNRGLMDMFIGADPYGRRHLRGHVRRPVHRGWALRLRVERAVHPPHARQAVPADWRALLVERSLIAPRHTWRPRETWGALH